MIEIDSECPDTSKPLYWHLDPIVTVLLDGGNELARSERWGSSKDGFSCFLTKPIDFQLVRESCRLPTTVVLSEPMDLIACQHNWATIYGSKAKWGVL